MKLFHFLKRNKLFAVLLAAELAVLCTLIAGLFGVPYKLTLTPDLFENRFPDIAAEDADGLKVWNQIDFRSEEPITFSSQGQALRAGAYEVTVSYFSCQTPDAPTFNLLNSAGTLDFSSEMVPAAVSFDTLRLDDCHRTQTSRLWVSSGAALQDLTATLTYRQGQLYLYAVTLTEQPIYRLTRLFCWLFCFAAADALLWLLFARTGERGAAHRRALRLPLCLLGITVLACLPLFSNYLYVGHDLDYHLQRITAMAAELSYGQFPVRLTTTTLNGYGYANPLCYCELFLLLPALLYNLWLPLRTCYQIYIFAVTLATCLIAYFSFGRITESRRLGLLGAMLYTLSCYRLVCVYTRAAVGEFTAMAFFPLVLLGLYGLYTKDKPRFADWLPMSLGMAAMVQSLRADGTAAGRLLPAAPAGHPIPHTAAGLDQGSAARSRAERMVSCTVFYLWCKHPIHGQRISHRKDPVAGAVYNAAAQPVRHRVWRHKQRHKHGYDAFPRPSADFGPCTGLLLPAYPAQ